jgi:pSer/pThr/pTyr-binding forkhead associated (FHA) protein
MAPVSFQLVMRSGPNPGKVFQLNKSEIYIGRDINNDIVISDAEISRKHARLMLQGGGYVLEDLGSTNGSFVNGQRLMGPHQMHPGELMMLGENVGLSYEAVAADPNATVVSSAQVGPTPFVQPREAQASANQPYGTPATQVESFAEPSEFEQPGMPQVEAPYPAQPAQSGAKKWLLAGCGCLVVLFCLVVVGIPLIYLVAPQAFEGVICAGPLKSITNAILSILGTAYYCP